MTTIQTKSDYLSQYYETVQQRGSLRTLEHAARWTTAVLKTLALNLDRKNKKQLAKALPEPLAEDLLRMFWLLHFRDTSISRQEFCNRVARRAGNSDWQFAEIPTIAVFHGLKALIDNQLNQQIADTLSPDLRAMWEQA